MSTTTIGLSPKLIPSIIVVVLGVLVALLVDRTVGLTAIVGGLGTLGAGYAAPAGHVAIADDHPGPDPDPDELEEIDDLEPSGPDSRLTPDTPTEDTP